MSRCYALALAAVAAALGAANAQVTHPSSPVTVIVDPNNYRVVYSWTYTHGADPYIDFTATWSNVQLGSTFNNIEAVAISHMSSDLEDVTSGGDSSFGMKASRSLIVTFDHYSSSSVQVSAKLVVEACSATVTECNTLPGWTNPATKMVELIQQSSTACNLSRMQIIDSSVSKSSGRGTASVTVRMYADAFEQCSINTATASKFRLNFAPNAQNHLRWALWRGTRLSDPTGSGSTHKYRAYSNDVKMFTFVAGTPTMSPTKGPTESPTTPIPSKSPTTGVPTKSPTPVPTRSPIKPISSCANEEHWIKCNHINTWYPDITHQPTRLNRIRSACTSRSYCQYCHDAARTSNSGCRPALSEDGDRFDEASLCELWTQDPFQARGCVPFSQCPSPEVMGACRAVNQMSYPRGQRWRLRKTCRQGRYYNGVWIAGDACTWCNGVCRAVDPYQGLERIICKTPLLFDVLRQCPIA